MRTGLANRIREYMKAKGEATIVEIREALNIENDTLRFALKDFVKRGELNLNGNIYIVANIQQKQVDKVDQAWKAMRYLTSWTVSDIAIVAGVDPRYVSDMVKRFKKEGYVQRIGINKEGKHIYCVDRNMRERPVLKNWRRLGGKNESCNNQRQ